MSNNYFYTSLEELCCSNLKQAFNRDTLIFDRQIDQQQWQPTLGTENLTSTCICLVSIDRAEIKPSEIGFNPTQTFNALLKLAQSKPYPGGIGLIIWANAVWEMKSLAELQPQLSIPFENLTAYLTSLTTMETAWLVSGLLHEYQRHPAAKTKEYLDIALDTLLNRYQTTSHLMVHAAANAPWSHRLRRWVANFADQIYSVQAFAFAAIAGGNDSAKQTAESLAKQLTKLQGELGQWWWHYNPRNGEVLQFYPVYSVHQYGMAPMALAALQAAQGSNFNLAVQRGRDWLEHNELNLKMIDRQANTVWRDIEYHQTLLKQIIRKTNSLRGKPAKLTANQFNLKLNYETRPYEWGWCLYAGAIERGINKKLHIV
jgi:hypothetical protein